MDLAIFYFFNNLASRSDPVDWLIIFLAKYLIMVVVAVVMIATVYDFFSGRKHLRILFWSLAAAILARLGVVELIRLFYHRPRPFSVLSVNQLLSDSAYSFPSGHAAFLFALATVVYLRDKKWGIGLYTVALIVGLARVAAGLHWPSDILGGMGVGILVGWLVGLVADRTAKNES